MAEIQINFYDNNPKQQDAWKLMILNRFTLLYGGSRSGKSFIIMFEIIRRALKKKSRHLIVRLHFSDVKRSVINETFKDVCDIMGVHDYKLNLQDFYARFGNGSEIWFGGIDDARGLDKILGTEYSSIWFNEASQISYGSYTILKTRLAQKSGLKNRIYIDENPPSKLHWTYKVFFKNIEPKDNVVLKNPEQYVYLKMDPKDNEKNVDAEYLEMLEALPKEERLRFYQGEFADQEESALFSEANFNRNRVTKYPELKEVVVSVDPATTAKITSDETGITVEGKGFDNRGYLLEDISGIYSPKQWATKACGMYKKWNANCIVAEINQGGDMVKYTIQTIDENIPVKTVHATKGKLLRAEPISAKYDDDKISHVGTFPDAETEMALYTGKPGEKSPNRLDAIVHGFTYLFPVGIYSDSEIFNRDVLKYWKEYDFTESTNFLYIKISSSASKTPHYNFLALFVKIKDQKLFITDCIFNEMLPSDNIEQINNKLVGFGTKQIFLECNISFAAFAHELKQTKLPVRGIKEFNQEDNRIISEAKFIKETFVFEKAPESIYYKNYIQQLQAYTVASDVKESFAANILPSAAYVVKKLYRSLLIKKDGKELTGRKTTNK
jgi:phage terminase large subunit-like protein